ncbi:MAG: hypothetical protein ACK56F_26710, partial [bacterium]
GLRRLLERFQGQRIAHRQLGQRHRQQLLQRDGVVRMSLEDLLLVAHHEDRHPVRMQVLGGHPLDVVPADALETLAESLPEVGCLGVAPGELLPCEDRSHLDLGVEVLG